MKKQILSIVMIGAMLAGCATHSTVTSTKDAVTGNVTTTKDSTSQSDNAALSLIGSTVKIGGDIISAVLPPFIPYIVDGLTKPVTTPPAAPAPAK